MEDGTRGLLVVGTLIVVLLVAVVWFFCTGLSDIVHWTSCQEVLAWTQPAADAVLRFVAHGRDAVRGR